MEKRLRIFFVALLALLILAVILPVAASVLYDGPVVLTLSSGPAPEGIEAFLNNQLRFIHADFQYIGHSTHDLCTSEAHEPHAVVCLPSAGVCYAGHRCIRSLPCFLRFLSNESVFCYSVHWHRPGHRQPHPKVCRFFSSHR